MLFGLVFSIAFITFTAVSLATEIHVEDGCVDIVVVTPSGPTSDLNCACIPDNDFWHPTRCHYKDYNTGWYWYWTMRVIIFDPPCKEKFDFPTRYAQVFYTVDGCLRDPNHHREPRTPKLRRRVLPLTEKQAIHCCPVHPYRYPYVTADANDQTSSATSDTRPRLDEEASSGKEPTSNEVSPYDENPIFPDDAMTGMTRLNWPAAKRGISAKSPYRIRKKRSVAER